MAVQERTKNIKGARWAANTLPATRGIPILAWILSLIGEPIGRVGAGALAGGGLAGIKDEAIALAAKAITQRLDQPPTVVHLQALFVDVTRDNRPVDFDLYFAANYGEFSEVTAWLIEENFGSFFVGNPLLKSLGAMAIVQSSTPPAT